MKEAQELPDNPSAKSQEIAPDKLAAELQAFLRDFKKYANAICGSSKARASSTNPEDVASPLRLRAPTITDILLEVTDNKVFYLPIPFGASSDRIVLKDLLNHALMGGNNAMPHNFRAWDALVTSTLEESIGVLKAGLWPPKTPAPVLVIRDQELLNRCTDLLSAPGNYDRVIREATTVLESRIRNKPPFEVLTKLIPISGDQIGENLVNKLFSPNSPVLSVSSDKNRRIPFLKILLGVFAYLRHPYHHKIDSTTEWSWA